jgi:hypothetical protein
MLFFGPFTRRLWNFSSTHIGVMWSFQPSEERVVMSGNQNPLAGYLVHSWSERCGLILSAIVLSFSFFSWVLHQQFFWRGRTLWNFLWRKLEHTLLTFLWLQLIFIDAASLEDMHGPGYWSWKVSRHADDYGALKRSVPCHVKWCICHVIMLLWENLWFKITT